MELNVKVVRPGSMIYVPTLVTNLARKGVVLPHGVCFEVTGVRVDITGDGITVDVTPLYTVIALDRDAEVCYDEEVEVNLDMFDYSDV